jgi:hypothetical protein
VAGTRMPVNTVNRAPALPEALSSAAPVPVTASGASSSGESDGGCAAIGDVGRPDVDDGLDEGMGRSGTSPSTPGRYIPDTG